MQMFEGVSLLKEWLGIGIILCVMLSNRQMH